MGNDNFIHQTSNFPHNNNKFIHQTNNFPHNNNKFIHQINNLHNNNKFIHQTNNFHHNNNNFIHQINNLHNNNNKNNNFIHQTNNLLHHNLKMKVFQQELILQLLDLIILIIKDLFNIKLLDNIQNQKLFHPLFVREDLEQLHLYHLLLYHFKK